MPSFMGKGWVRVADPHSESMPDVKPMNQDQHSAPKLKKLSKSGRSSEDAVRPPPQPVRPVQGPFQGDKGECRECC